MQCSVFCATSLDGFLARPNGAFDFLPHSDPSEKPADDHGFGAFMASVDYVVLGRNTFDVVLKMSKTWFYPKPVYVLTHRPLKLPPHLKGKVESGRHSPEILVALMRKRGARRLYIDGGRTIQAFLRAGLIDDLTISQIPVLIGKGIPLFGSVAKDVRLDIMSSTARPEMVQTVYRVANGPARRS